MATHGNQKLGTIVRLRRRELGLTQTELAKMVGLYDASAISKIEKAQTDITATTMQKLADALEITAGALLGEKPLPPSPNRGEVQIPDYFNNQFMEKLTKLTEMYKEGLLTDEEFSLAKARLLK